MTRITSPRLIDRTDELARLVDAWGRLREDGTTVAVVAGEAGIGKTRLVTEFGHRVRACGARVLVGACPEIGAEAMPNAPLRAMLRELDEPAEPELVLGAVERLAERVPLVLVFEDLHWADATTRALVAFLARNLAAPVLLIATYRSDELHRGHPLLPLLAALQRLDRLERLQLQPFNRAQVAELAEAITGTVPPAPELDRLHRISQGNPFYVEELIAAPDGLPAGLEHVVHARLAGFAERELQLLRMVAAAVAVDLTTLAHVAGREYDELERSVRMLVERHALVPSDSGVQLRHALVREVLYGELLPGERERVHAGYAHALEDAAPQRIGEIAYHWWHAGDPGRALPASIAAGRAAEADGAIAEAHVCYERALELSERIGPVERLELVEAASRTATALGRAEWAIELVRRELARTSDPLREVRLLTLLWPAQAQTWEPALADLDRAVEQLAKVRAPHDAHTFAELHVETAAGLASAGRTERAAALLRDALPAAQRLGDEALEARALLAHARVLAFGGDERAIVAAERALTLADRAGDPATRTSARQRIAWELIRLGRFEDSLAASEHVPVHVEALYRLGRWDDARRAAEELPPRKDPVLPPALRVRSGSTADGLHALHAEALEYGEGPSVLAATGVAVVELATREQRFGDARATAAATLDALLPGCLPEAAEVAASALAAEADRARIARRDAAECIEHAQRTVARLRAAAAGTAYGRRLAAFLAQCDAELARAHGRSADWAAVAERWTALGERFPAAYAAFRAAEADLRAPRNDAAARARAVERLRFAAETAGELGAAPLLADVQGLARRARLQLTRPVETPPPPAVPGPGLTEREHDVLRLLVDGRSNGEIGRSLYISTKTASTHVSHIIRKLNASNRVEAAGLAVRLGLT